jgi:hypothetical protein
MYLVATNLNETCEESIQCTVTFGDNATCSGEQTCICKPDNHFVIPHQCILNRGKKCCLPSGTGKEIGWTNPGDPFWLLIE